MKKSWLQSSSPSVQRFTYNYSGTNLESVYEGTRKLRDITSYDIFGNPTRMVEYNYLQGTQIGEVVTESKYKTETGAGFGNLIEEKVTVKHRGATLHSNTTKWTFDGLGRRQKMTFMDEQFVDYEYEDETAEKVRGLGPDANTVLVAKTGMIQAKSYSGIAAQGTNGKRYIKYGRGTSKILDVSVGVSPGYGAPPPTTIVRAEQFERHLTVEHHRNNRQVEYSFKSVHMDLVNDVHWRFQSGHSPKHIAKNEFNQRGLKNTARNPHARHGVTSTSYDNFGRIESTGWNSHDKSHVDHNYDGLGRRAGVQDLGTFNVNYIVGSVGKYQSASLDVDQAGYTVGIPTGSKNRNFAFDYDSRDNLQQDEQFTYQYDGFNRVMKATVLDTSHQMRGAYTEYLYDSYNRRVATLPVTPPMGQGALRKELYTYDGSQVVDILDLGPSTSPTAGSAKPRYRTLYGGRHERPCLLLENSDLQTVGFEIEHHIIPDDLGTIRTVETRQPGNYDNPSSQNYGYSPSGLPYANYALGIGAPRMPFGFYGVLTDPFTGHLLLEDGTVYNPLHSMTLTPNHDGLVSPYAMALNYNQYGVQPLGAMADKFEAGFATMIQASVNGIMTGVLQYLAQGLYSGEVHGFRGKGGVVYSHYFKKSKMITDIAFIAVDIAIAVAGTAAGGAGIAYWGKVAASVGRIASLGGKVIRAGGGTIRTMGRINRGIRLSGKFLKTTAGRWTTSALRRKCSAVQAIERFSPAIGSRLRRVIGACFVAGTLVSTADGPVPIEQLQIGDQVWSKNPETGEVDLRSVTSSMVRSVDSLIHLAYKPLKSPIGPDLDLPAYHLAGSEEHPFWVDGKGWVEMHQLAPGQVLLGPNDEKFLVVSCTPQKCLEVVYNIAVENNHTYFAGSLAGAMVFVHNAKECLYVHEYRGKIIYIGITKNFKQRAKQHRLDPLKKGKMRRVSEYNSHDIARTLEAITIRKTLLRADVDVTLPILKQLKKAGLKNQNRGRRTKSEGHSKGWSKKVDNNEDWFIEGGEVIDITSKASSTK